MGFYIRVRVGKRSTQEIFELEYSSWDSVEYGRRILIRTARFLCYRHQVLVQRSDSANKERGGRHLLANHKLRGSKLPAAPAARHSAPKPNEQQARHTL